MNVAPTAFTLEVKVVRPSETSVNIYQITKHHFPDVSNHHSHHRQKFKSHENEIFSKNCNVNAIKVHLLSLPTRLVYIYVLCPILLPVYSSSVGICAW
jgi:hypothetical protein